MFWAIVLWKRNFWHYSQKISSFSTILSVQRRLVLKNFGKDLKVHTKFPYLSDLAHEIPLKIIIQGLYIKRKAGKK